MSMVFSAGQEIHKEAMAALKERDRTQKAAPCGTAGWARQFIDPVKRKVYGGRPLYLGRWYPE